MDRTEWHRQLLASDRAFGTWARSLRLGEFSIRIEGLDRELAGILDRRWGGFLESGDAAPPSATLRVRNAGSTTWLERGEAAEAYRLEAVNDLPRRVIASYHFALCAEPEDRAWRVAVTERPTEPHGRILDNALRYLTARLAVDHGGFALHAAGVLDRDRAYLFAGPSRSGKTTAVAACPGASSLGDDFAVVLPQDGAWSCPALPFDNAEAIEHEPPRGLFPVAGIWRLHPSGDNRVERPRLDLAVASLMACVAFPWVMPESADRLLDRVAEVVSEGLFGHLHFRKEGGFWERLIEGAD